MPKLQKRWRDLTKTEQAIIIALVGGAVALNPVGGKIVVSIAAYYLKKWWNKGGPHVPPESDPELVRASLYRLKRNQYIAWKHSRKNKQIKLILTAKGRRSFDNKDQFQGIKIERPHRWDGRWRFILFDVPEKSRSIRDTFRYHIKGIGFFRFQKSVWIHPFPCNKEVQYFTELLGIGEHVIMFTAKIDNDRTLRRYFLREKILQRRDLGLRDRGIRY